MKNLLSYDKNRVDSQPSGQITQEICDVYERDGVVCLRGIFAESWLTLLAGAVQGAMTTPGPHAEEFAAKGSSGRFFGDLELAHRLPDFRRFAFESPAAEIAGRIMDASQIRFFYDQLLIKEPGTTERTPWHQDQPYWAISGRQVCSVWVPLDPVSHDTGVEFICGSHRWPEFNPYHFVDASPYINTGLPPLPDIDAERDKHTIVSFDMAPGDCLVFQALIVHGAPGNSGHHRRRALATRWAGDDARYCHRPGEVAIPTDHPLLAHGDRLSGERFPLVWTAADSRYSG